MISKITNLATAMNIDALDQIADRIGLTTIASSLGITMAQESIASWTLTEYALIISAVGGVLFIIEKLLVIYLRFQESRKAAKDAATTKKSRLAKRRDFFVDNIHDKTKR